MPYSEKLLAPGWRKAAGTWLGQPTSNPRPHPPSSLGPRLQQAILQRGRQQGAPGSLPQQGAGHRQRQEAGPQVNWLLSLPTSGQPKLEPHISGQRLRPRRLRQAAASGERQLAHDNGRPAGRGSRSKVGLAAGSGGAATARMLPSKGGGPGLQGLGACQVVWLQCLGSMLVSDACC